MTILHLHPVNAQHADDNPEDLHSWNDAQIIILNIVPCSYQVRLR